MALNTPRVGHLPLDTLTWWEVTPVPLIQTRWHCGRARLLLMVECLWVFPCLLTPSLTFLLSLAEYTVINEACPGAEWNIMCRECCEYDQIECVCPGKKEVVGYTIPCCRNEDNECDSCLIHPGECATGHHKLSSHYLRSWTGTEWMSGFWQAAIHPGLCCNGY